MQSKNKEKIDIKKEKEKRVVRLMINLYCKGNHTKPVPCKSCSELISYVDYKIENCPFIETKTYCSNCKVHCYSDEMRNKIKKVMKYSGPRMIFHHPLLLIDHGYQSLKYKKINRNTNT
ncbi:MAG: nitrous oxide-stimulated promoter family protein [Clostridium sp.]|nr:nitrous oxide-stimulated promoter family protein [Clostridium sp.]